MTDQSDKADVQCIRMRLKPDSLSRVRAWQAELNLRSNEVLETLRDEGVFIESVFLDEIDDEHYLIYYMRGVNLGQSREVAQKSSHTIDEYHHAFMEAVRADGGHSKLECLIDFENRPGSPPLGDS